MSDLGKLVTFLSLRRKRERTQWLTHDEFNSLLDAARELEALKEAMAEVDSTLFHSLTVGMLRERAAEILAEILAEKEKKQ